MEDIEEEAADLQEAQPAEPAPQEPAVETEHQDAPAAPVTGELMAWFDQWFPESPPANHPIPYMSGAWHHAREAFEDLQARLAPR